jgi:acetylornithine/succinyldiaminopimelate/putrescine aminotransferase/predicted amino acid dehydrogenase
MADTQESLAGLSREERREMLGRLMRGRRTVASGGHPFATYVNPDLARVLRGLALDKHFVRGEGCWLVDDRDERALDFTAAYGALPFGHRPMEVWDAVSSMCDAAEPIFAQPSLLGAAGELARSVVAVAPTGLERVTFANSGAEAIEVALKIARSATRRHGVLSTDDGFHGKTLGALSVTGRRQYQEEFGAPVSGFERVPFGDMAALDAALAGAPDRYACFVVEPIQGEGGVRVPPTGYLREVRRSCSKYGVLFVLDEVQTGLGRTGRLFACEHEDVVPDVMTLAKALGGGVVPIGAVLCRQTLATEGLALRHTSTFAGNALAARVGLRSLELLTRDGGALVRAVAEHGARLERGLREIQARHREVVSDIRGRGFLLGLELTADVCAFPSQGLLASMAAQETLALAVCSHLLNVEHVRLAPTVFGARVLRIEPPLVAGREECEFFLEALDRTLALVSSGDAAALLGHLVGHTHTPQREPRRAGGRTVVVPRARERRFAFVLHAVDIESFHDFDAGLAAFGNDQLEQLMGRFAESRSTLVPSAFLIGAGRVESQTGVTAYGEIVGVPFTARQLLQLPAAEAVGVVREAVELARDRGAGIVGLGAYSSIITGNARLLGDLGVPLTTGNGFTVATAVEAVRRAAAERGLDLAGATVAVVGASGAIGRSVARLLARRAGSLVLVGNAVRPEASLLRLRGIAAELVESLAIQGVEAPLLDGVDREADLLGAVQDRGRLKLGVDLEEMLPDADIVLTATSAPEPIVAAGALKRDAIVCDIAQPGNVARAVAGLRADVLLFEGGIVELPGRRDFGVNYGLAAGLAWACMAETMTLALDGAGRLASVGDRLSDEAVLELGGLAAAHGFRLAPIGVGGAAVDGWTSGDVTSEGMVA